MRLSAALPFRGMIRLNKAVGRVLGRIIKGPRRIARRNIELCFPGLSPNEVDDLLRRHFEALGACVGELGAAWFAPVDRLHPLFRVEGREHLQAALERGKGVILYTGHFTAFEICAPTLKTLMPRFAFMYSRRNNALLDEIQARGRLRCGHESFSSDNVRAMLRSLGRNAVVWYASDQVYLGPNSRLVPFFGEPAMTNVAISRLARLSGATVVPFSFCRLGDDSGYRMKFEAPLEGFPSDDPVEDTRRLVSRLEEFVRCCPEQYLWTHKRFKGRPAPLPDVYRRAGAKG
jgi:KDO2-lipid IV(A) lauroyltransferase